MKKPLLLAVAMLLSLAGCNKNPEVDPEPYDGKGPRAVDLGLSVKWADRNLGAENPEDYGDYYAWGEVAPKNYYGLGTYSFYKDSEFTKYYANLDNKTALVSDDDAATTALGGKWRMPSPKEIEELCATKGKPDYQWKWKPLNGHKGWEITYLSTGSSIFLPAVGYMDGEDNYNAGSSGCYWSLSIGSFYHQGRTLFISSEEACSEDQDRDFGCAIRPVSGDYIYISRITLDQTEVELAVGDKITIKKTVEPEDAFEQRVTWSSSDESVATVTRFGEVTAVGGGQAVITATAEGKSASCTVNVHSVPVESVAFDVQSKTLLVGESFKLNVIITPKNATDRTVVWYTSDADVVTVKDGVVTAHGIGTESITATVGGKSAVCWITAVSLEPRMVDLGLKVKWADRNLGAATQYDPGYYFAWGETEPKENYEWTTYKWGTSSKSLTKYVRYSDCGQVDGKTNLDPEDDAARVKLGGKWRMPTEADRQELMDTRNKSSYVWTWVNNPGQVGWEIKYVTTGQTLFLPAAGRLYGQSKKDYFEKKGFYWLSSCSGGDSGRIIHFDASAMRNDFANERCQGLPIRPVADK